MRRMPIVVLFLLAACSQSSGGSHGATDDDETADNDPVTELPVGDDTPTTVDYCTDGGGCSAAATCTNGVAAAVCTCNALYAGDGFTCTLNVPTWSAWANKSESATQNVTIPGGTVLYLDEPLQAGVLRIDGDLRAVPSLDVSITARKIEVYGTLSIGTPEQPYEANATITFVGEDALTGELPHGIETFDNGIVNLVGVAPATTWTHLTADAEAETTTLEIAEAEGWRAGDTLAITPTDFYPSNGVSPYSALAGSVMDRTHVSVITAITNDTTVEIETGPHAARCGTTELIDGLELDERAEVANLSRNIVLQSDAPDVHFALYGAHQTLDSIEMRGGGTGSERAVELRGGGSVAHATFIGASGCIGLSGGAYTIRDNVCINTTGSGIGMSPGAGASITETTLIERNLVSGVTLPDTYTGHAEDTALPDICAASGFVGSVPVGHYVDNVAADSEGCGFWLLFAEGTTTPVGEFTGNVAHSNLRYGISRAGAYSVDSGGSVTFSTSTSLYVPQDAEGQATESVFSNFRVYKNATGGIAASGYNLRWQGGVLADQLRNDVRTFLAYSGWFTDSYFVAHSSNKGTALLYDNFVSGLPDTSGLVFIDNNHFNGYKKSADSNDGVAVLADNAYLTVLYSIALLRDNVFTDSQVTQFGDLPAYDAYGIYSAGVASYWVPANDDYYTNPTCTSVAVLGGTHGKSCTQPVYTVLSAYTSADTASSPVEMKFERLEDNSVKGSRTFSAARDNTYARGGSVSESGQYRLTFPQAPSSTSSTTTTTIRYWSGPGGSGALVGVPFAPGATAAVTRNYERWGDTSLKTVTAAASLEDAITSMGTSYYVDTTAKLLYVVIGVAWGDPGEIFAGPYPDVSDPDFITRSVQPQRYTIEITPP